MLHAALCSLDTQTFIMYIHLDLDLDLFLHDEL